MFCKYCGKEIEDGRELCDECLAKQLSNKDKEAIPEIKNVESQDSSVAFVSDNNVNPVMSNSFDDTNPISGKSSNNTNPINMGGNINSNDNIGNTNNVNNANNNTSTNTATQNNNSTKDSKSKIAAGLFGIFLGAFGVHNFYLGYTGKAVAQLLITLLSCGILSPVSGIWGLIEGILILAGETKTDAYGNELKE